MVTRDAWPWLAVAALGAFHGLHPATGWLFAVALGVRRRSRATVYLSLIPILLGHALSILVVAAAVIVFSWVVDLKTIARVAGLALIVWGLSLVVLWGRPRNDPKLPGGMSGLLGWSFVISMSHGTGLLLVPAVLPLCLKASAAGELFSGGSLGVASAAIGLHLLALLLSTTIIATCVYRIVGAQADREMASGLHHVWTAALLITGLVLLI